MARSSETSRRRLLAPLGDGDYPACFDTAEGRWLTAPKLRRVVDECASRLEAPGKSLAFCFCDNGLMALAAYLACWAAGHAVLLLDAKLDEPFRERLCALYQPEFLLAPQPVWARTGSFGANYVSTTSAGLVIGRSSARQSSRIHPDLAVLLSTSGSTGSPKLVKLSYENIVANALQICDALAIQPPQRAVTSLPMHYSYGLSVVNSHLAAGASLVLTGEGILSPAFWAAVRQQRCTSLAGVPYMYQMLRRLDLDALDVPELNTMTQAGGKLDDDLIARFHGVMKARDGRFFVMYGQTEATARIAVLPSDALPAKRGSVGKPVPGGVLAIEKEGIPIQTAFSEGEVVFNGPNVMMGYATCREDLAMGPELDSTLHTGDLGYLDDSGFLYITGRTKRISKILGLRINLDEVESLLKGHGPTAVIEDNERLLIFCEYGEDPDHARYAQALGETLKIHPSLFAFRRVESLPLTANGKIDYRKLAIQ